MCGYGGSTCTISEHERDSTCTLYLVAFPCSHTQTTTHRHRHEASRGGPESRHGAGEGGGGTKKRKKRLKNHGRNDENGGGGTWVLGERKI